MDVAFIIFISTGSFFRLKNKLSIFLKNNFFLINSPTETEIDTKIEPDNITSPVKTSEESNLPTALPYKQTSILDKNPKIENQEPKSSGDESSSNSDTIEFHEPLKSPRRPNSYCSVYTIPDNLFQENQHCEITVLQKDRLVAFTRIA